MNPTALRAAWHVAVLTVVVALMATGWMLAGRLSLFSGLAADAPANDTRLTEIAADIQPTISAMEAFRRDTGAYPVIAGDLVGRLPQGVVADSAGDTLSLDTGHGAVWGYLRTEDGQGFELTRHLVDGGSLTATNDHGHITWLYAETDEDDVAPVTLSPAN